MTLPCRVCGNAADVYWHAGLQWLDCPTCQLQLAPGRESREGQAGDGTAVKHLPEALCAAVLHP
jgi:Fe-S oxidoreductase